MSSSRLREWIRRYGDRGYAMAAAYLALHYLWKRRIGLVAVAAVLCLIAVRLRHGTQPVSSNASSPTPSPATTVALAEPEPPYDHVTFADAGDRWRLVVTWIPNAEHARNELSVYRNDHLIRKLRAEDRGGVGLEVKRITLASGRSVVGVLCYPGAGHATAKHFFTVRDRRLLYMGQVRGENGGPLFRDEDGDGRPEWVFDNYCWYEQYTEGPTHYLVFKETKAGTLRLWKRRANPTREHLPDRFGFECC